MALKDLIAEKAVLAEGAIEEIISDYIRYDPEEKVIAFTPAASGLQNKAKVLVYLVALQGWPFVTKETVPIDAKPHEIEEQVGIQGGTLRPILKELKDRHIIAERGGRYFVRPITLSAIRLELNVGEKSIARPKPRRARTKKTIPPESAAETSEEKRDLRRPSNKKAGNLVVRFDKWIDGGFFDEPKTLADVQRRFHKEGVILPRTSIPQYLLKAVREGRLTREETDANNKRVWAYRSQD
jgi:hypothetical protein